MEPRLVLHDWTAKLGDVSLSSYLRVTDLFTFVSLPPASFQQRLVDEGRFTTHA